MKYIFLSTTSLLSVFLINCSTIPEIKPYERQSKELTVEDVTNHDNEFDTDSLFKDEPSTPIADDSSSNGGEEMDIAIEQPPKKDPVVLPEFETPTPVVEKQEKPKMASRKVASAFKNGLHTFSQNCSMKAKPNESSADVGRVEAGKKLWLDKHDSEWLKAYKKSGTVYISADCVK